MPLLNYCPRFSDPSYPEDFVQVLNTTPEHGGDVLIGMHVHGFPMPKDDDLRLCPPGCNTWVSISKYWLPDLIYALEGGCWQTAPSATYDQDQIRLEVYRDTEVPGDVFFNVLCDRPSHASSNGRCYVDLNDAQGYAIAQILRTFTIS